MDALLIEGPAKLHGNVTVSGSKNSALPLLFSSLLFDGEVKFTNVPRLWDIETTLHLLADMGTTSEWNKELGTLRGLFASLSFQVNGEKKEALSLSPSLYKQCR